MAAHQSRQKRAETNAPPSDARRASTQTHEKRMARRYPAPITQSSRKYHVGEDGFEITYTPEHYNEVLIEGAASSASAGKGQVAALDGGYRIVAAPELRIRGADAFPCVGARQGARSGWITKPVMALLDRLCVGALGHRISAAKGSASARRSAWRPCSARARKPTRPRACIGWPSWTHIEPFALRHPLRLWLSSTTSGNPGQ
jgi:hypothetical protein